MVCCTVYAVCCNSNLKLRLFLSGRGPVPGQIGSTYPHHPKCCRLRSTSTHISTLFPLGGVHRVPQLYAHTHAVHSTIQDTTPCHKCIGGFDAGVPAACNTADDIACDNTRLGARTHLGLRELGHRIDRTRMRQPIPAAVARAAVAQRDIQHQRVGCGDRHRAHAAAGSCVSERASECVSE